MSSITQLVVLVMAGIVVVVLPVVFYCAAKWTREDSRR